MSTHPLPVPRTVQVWDCWEVYNVLTEEGYALCSTEALANEVRDLVEAAFASDDDLVRFGGRTWELTIDTSQYAVRSCAVDSAELAECVALNVVDALEQIGNSITLDEDEEQKS